MMNIHRLDLEGGGYEAEGWGLAKEQGLRAPGFRGFSEAEKKRPQRVQVVRLRCGRGCTRGHAYFGGRAAGKTFACFHAKAAQWRQRRAGRVSQDRRGGRPTQGDAKDGPE